MKVHLDTSILVSLFSLDAFTPRADAFLRAAPWLLSISDFASAEFSAAISRQVRMSHLSLDEARRVFASFDEWRARRPRLVRLEPADIADADAFIRRADVSLRAPDAIHLATARRLGAALATFDARMAVDARTLGVQVAEL